MPKDSFAGQHSWLRLRLLHISQIQAICTVSSADDGYWWVEAVGAPLTCSALMQEACTSVSGTSMQWLAGPSGVIAGVDVDSCGSDSTIEVIEACTSPFMIEGRNCPRAESPTSAAISLLFQSSSMLVSCLERSLPKSCLRRISIFCRTCIQEYACVSCG